jgi:hypothetical protein
MTGDAEPRHSISRVILGSVEVGEKKGVKKISAKNEEEKI